VVKPRSLCPVNDVENIGKTPHEEKSPDRVIGDEAKVHTDWQDLEGVVVDVEITDWPSATQSPRGRVIEILGEENDFGVDVEIMIRKFHLPHRFPPEVIEEAQAIENRHPRRSPAPPPRLPRPPHRHHRRRNRPRLRRRRPRPPTRKRQLRTASPHRRRSPIRNAQLAARSGSPPARHQRLFPDRAVPMLPLELSTDICSLRPQVDRLVLSCTMEIDHQGEIVGYEINEGVIRSANRMTYTAVNAVIEGDAASRAQRICRPGRALRTHARSGHDPEPQAQAPRLHRFRSPRAVIEFDEFGMMKSITRSERNIAHRLIEEFMLSANECVAHYLENKRIASLYRIHEKPDAKRVYDFEVIAATFGYSLGVGALPIQRVQLKADRRDARGTGKRVREIEVPKEVHITPRMYQKLTEKIAGKPEERILSFLMLRSLKQARYSEENRGHFALAATTYTHFTSPIRRYPDLIVHRILKEVLRDSPEKLDGEVPVGMSQSPLLAER
jgi:ribonuclease R